MQQLLRQEKTRKKKSEKCEVIINDWDLKDKHNPEYLKTIEKEETRDVPRNQPNIFDNNELTKISTQGHFEISKIKETIFKTY